LVEKIAVGVIGCGGFARGMHIPNMRKNPKFRIAAAMDIDAARARQVAEETGAAYGTDDLTRILSDKGLDAIFVTTWHDSHADLTIKAAGAGKHVLCEKPMALNERDCRRIAEAVRKAGVRYTVGYNRGIAPLVTRAKDLLAGVTGKRMIYHRIQAPFPESHWTHKKEVGGGRFVGEGCHIFDLICELIPSPPVSVFASGGTFLDASVVKIPDSAIATITFADGSVGTTLIASDGCPDFEKEATEIYCAARAIHIQNFQRMDYYGFEGHRKTAIALDEVDKGHAIEIDRFADAILKGTECPNGLEKAMRAAMISYKVDRSVETGAPVPISASDYKA